MIRNVIIRLWEQYRERRIKEHVHYNIDVNREVSIHEYGYVKYNAHLMMYNPVMLCKRHIITGYIRGIHDRI